MGGMWYLEASREERAPVENISHQISDLKPGVNVAPKLKDIFSESLVNKKNRFYRKDILRHSRENF